MRTINYSLIFMLFHFYSYAQLSENFDDGNFNLSPVWKGDTNYFTVNPSLQLQSNGPSRSSTIQLYTSNSRFENTQWEFYIKLDFDITTGNWCKIYLMSDQSDLKGALNGYFIKFDGSTNSIDLYKQTGTSNTLLIKGKTGRAGKTDNNAFKIKTIRDSQGNWALLSDSTGTGKLFFQEGKASNVSIIKTSYFGVVCTYTSTRRNKFYFDNFNISEAPFGMSSVSIDSKTTINILFNNPVDKATAENTFNYTINNSFNNPTNAYVDPYNPALVHLTLAGMLKTGTDYTLTASNIKNYLQDELGPFCSFTFKYNPSFNHGDVIITEIFADPSPPISLPDFEFVEIYNTLPDSINLEGFQLSDGSTVAMFPAYTIAPYSYLTLSASSNQIAFASFGKTLGLSTFPSLNNSDDQLFLKDKKGKVIYQIHYFDSWYGDNQKKEGGWSLEMIDIHNSCGEEENWSASIDPTGGTPGKQNSVFAYKPDLSYPVLIRSFARDSLSILLRFNEKIDSTFKNLYTFTLNNDFPIQSFRINPSNPKQITIQLNVPLEKKTAYTISYGGLKDCNGNTIPFGNETVLFLSEKAETGDILLSEVLFNPKSGGVDFVEIYNKSEKYINLKNWQFANVEKNIISNKKLFFTDDYIIPPHEYLTLTTKKNLLINYYPLGKISNIEETKELPAYNDDAGTVILFDSSSRQVDRFDYSETYHFPLLDDKEGVSLERLSFNAPTELKENWYSAAGNVGYATPGYANSQHYEQKKDLSGIWIEPKIFTPDGNGYKDFAAINYKFEQPGNMANITLYDSQGREIRRLVQNELLSAEGFYEWDGSDEKKQKVTSGVYIVYFETYSITGDNKSFKETLVVGQ